MPKRSYLLVLLAFSTIISSYQTSSGQVTDADKAAAEQSATQFWFGFDKGDLGQVYQNMAQEFRSTITQQQFVQQTGMMRIQSGGPAQTRSLVGSQYVVDLPNYPGEYFYTRFRARYSNGTVFQDAYIKKSDAGWRVWSFNVLAAPNEGN